ncbi:MAG: glycosyltransferase family 2 protein [Bryobacterales bacterium]|nr:glycosyltransferase family 2 protein [Bryobacterales bacterium]
MSAAPVTAIITNYRCEPWLARAIDSVLAQTYPPARLIVVDDAGDAAAFDAIRQRYSAQSIHWMRSSRNAGQFRIYNLLLPAIETEFVAFQDADDFSLPLRLATQLAQARRCNLDITGTHVQTETLDGQLVDLLQTPEDVNRTLRWRCRGRVIFGATTLCRTDFLRRLGGFDGAARFGADTELIYRAVFLGAVGNVPQPLYHACLRPGSLMRSPETGMGSPARTAYRRRIRSQFYRRRCLSLIGRLHPQDLRPRPNDMDFTLERIG